MVNNNAPLVSIVILNWNGIDDTKLCLEHVFKLNYPNYEVVVVDNGSAQDQKRYLSNLENIIYVDNPVNRGFTGGHIDGFKHANGDFILLLNNDAVIKQDYLKKAMPLFSDDSVAVVGGRSYFWNDEEPLFNEANRFYSYMKVDPISAETHLQSSDNNVVQEVNTVSGSSVIIRRSAIDKVGYLHEPFFAYYEETDLFARMKRAGYKILYNPSLHIWHKNGASSGAQGGSNFFFFHIFRNRFMYAARNFDDKNFKLFLRNYYKSGLKAIIDIPRGEVQKRYGVSYLKAILTNLTKLGSILEERKQIRENLGGDSYTKKIVAEQTQISIVIDATRLTTDQIAELEKKTRTLEHPLDEYIILVNRSQGTYSSTLSAGVRYVTDAGYFSSHPLNLACLAARMDWMLIASGTIPDAAFARQQIALNHETGRHVSSHDNSLIISKEYYQRIGGLSADPDSLSNNVVDILRYAYFDNTLFENFELESLPDVNDSKSYTVRRSYDKSLVAMQKPSRWQKILMRYYRLQQLSNLISWLVNLSIPTRLKLGRLKNLVVYCVSLRRVNLATELRHIRNEAHIYSNDFGVIEVNSANNTELKPALERARKNPNDIPVFIICFERVESLRVLVKKLEEFGLKKIVFIDNDSSYTPLLDFYDTNPYQVLRLYRNIGHTSPWSLSIIRSLIPRDYYIVTDPDVIPIEECPDDAVVHMLEVHKRHPEHQKVGFGLKIDDLPDAYPLKSSVIDWEQQFWKTKVDGEADIYEAGVDTTLALYKPFTYLYMLNPSVRMGEPYVARHMPWYSGPSDITDEDIYYKMRANANVTSWNLDELPERYKKEMMRAAK